MGDYLKKRWIKKVFKRRFYVISAIVLQILVFGFLIYSGSSHSSIVQFSCFAFSLVMALLIATRKRGGAYKLIWCFMILLFPIFGGLTYALFQFRTNTKRVTRRIEAITDELKQYYCKNDELLNEACKLDVVNSRTMRYLQAQGFPVYKAEDTTFFPFGENFYPVFIEELKKAEKFIFLEYFIIDEGKFWDSVLKILKEKAQKGVDVRVMYDDMGCFTLLPNNYPKMLAKYNIKCQIFNPFRPVLTSTQNNRNHRKMCVIDNRVAFTGGLNLADEYANFKSRGYYWKDCAIRLTGDCVRAFTLIYLQLWQLSDKTDFDFSLLGKCKNYGNDGFVQPYADCPADDENISEQVYLDLINNAKKYVYIVTPYFIVDENFISALGSAAKSGVDVRIITPEHSDSRFIHFVTRSYYRELIEDGVKIYEYDDSFVHSKLVVADGKIATVSTANFDYRSLYLQFECGVMMYGTQGVKEVLADIKDTFSHSHEILYNDCKMGVIKTLLQRIIRLFAPLM